MNTNAYPHRTGKLVLGWAAVAGLAVVATWGGGISMDLMLIVMSIVGLFSDDGVLPFEPDWAATAIRMAATAVAAIVIGRLVRFWRVSKGSCGRCGRSGVPPRNHRRLAMWAAGLSAIPAGGYAALKLHWAFGGTIGLTDPDVFGDIKPWSPGFADTAVMAAIGVMIAVGMAARWPRLPRWMLLTPALIGCTMLLPVAVLGTAVNVAGAFADSASVGLQPWVGWFVYSCFTVWGAGLAIVTLEYHYGTRGTCRACGRNQASRGSTTTSKTCARIAG